MEAPAAVTETYSRAPNSFVYVLPNKPLVLNGHPQQAIAGEMATDVVDPPTVTEAMVDVKDTDGTLNDTMVVHKIEEATDAMMIADAADVVESDMSSGVAPAMMGNEMTMDIAGTTVPTPEEMPMTTNMVSGEVTEHHTTTMVNLMETPIEMPHSMEAMTPLPMSLSSAEHIAIDTLEKVVSDTTADAEIMPMEPTALAEVSIPEKTMESKPMVQPDLVATTMMDIEMTTLSVEATTTTPIIDAEPIVVHSPLAEVMTTENAEPVPTITATSAQLTSMASIMNRPPLRPTAQEPILAMDELVTELAATATTMKTMAQPQKATKKPPRGGASAQRPSIVAVIGTILVGYVGWMVL